MDHEYAFEMATSAVRFGAGVTREVGADLQALGVRRALVITDPTVSRLAPMQTVRASLEAAGIDFEVFDRVRVEPTDESFLEAIAFARRGNGDGFVAVGGGSAIDTAKAANLYSTYPPDDFLDYVNPPIGKGMPVPGPLKPLIAVPTTAGTGSETTGVSIFDLTRLHAKTGIASRLLKPTLGLVDPENTRTLPPEVAASSGLDILSHALESFTALPYTARPRPDRPSLRPAYQGSNPISDLWSLQALRLVNQFLIRAVEDPEDDEARANMLLAASYAGIGFGNAGVHLPHGMSYPGLRPGPRLPGAGLRGGSSARAARHLGHPERAGRLPIHGGGQSRPASRRGGSARSGRQAAAGGRRGRGPRRSHHVVHAALERAERAAGRRLHGRRHSRTGRGHTAATPGHETLAAARGTGRPRTAVRAGDGRLVAAEER